MASKIFSGKARAHQSTCDCYRRRARRNRRVDVFTIRLWSAGAVRRAVGEWDLVFHYLFLYVRHWVHCLCVYGWIVEGGKKIRLYIK